MISKFFLRSAAASVALLLSTPLFAAQTLFTNVNVWDGVADEATPGLDVLISGNKVAEVGENLIAPDAVVINGGGKTLMPGLIDMHTHIMFPQGLPAHETTWGAAASGAMAREGFDVYMNQGFTTLRDMCGPANLGKAIAQGVLDGPRFYSSGACIGTTGGHTDWGVGTDRLGDKSNHAHAGNSYVVNGEDEWRAAARQNFRDGATFLKIMVGGGVASDFDPLESITANPAEIRAAVEVAEQFDSFVCMHVYQDEHINLAIDNGVTCVEHGFLMKEKTMKRMVKEGVALSAQSWMSYDVFKDPAGIPGFGPEQIAKGKLVNKGADDMFSWAKEHGVDMFQGGDVYTYDLIPFATKNISVLERWFTPVEALRSATSTAGKWLMKTGPKNPYKEAQLGTLKEGSYADVILVNGNPLKGTEILNNNDNVEVVMKDGKIYKNLLD
ncbi:amidohydrolase family protein [Congregibacter brevis]|uniref:Amidohydrolase family protein n=1 Tax=Congregibacter brevis TaxID=3081201 RepID=A0ABZ0I7R9_9GAMM|nr:amidohydrolase family protein [Congregibacter sp. IMCC45268]